MLIAVNFLFPSMSNNKFLELSIGSVIDMCDKYILFINEESRAGLKAKKEDVNKIIEISNKYDKVFLEFVEKNPDDEHTNMHEEIYVKKAFSLFPDAKVVWMVHPDEIYDEETKKKIKELLKDFPYIVRFWSRSYYGTPHWVGVPEKYPSRRLWKRGFDKEGNEYVPFSPNVELGKDEIVRDDIFFHHPSYVLTHEELEFKLNNSSHAIKRQYNPFFSTKFNRLKTNKSLVHLHPVNPEEVDHVEFVDEEINRRMMQVWFSHLMDNCPYNDLKNIFPNDYLMKPLERKALSGILYEMIPQKSNILEVGTWLGWSSVNMSISSPNSKIYTLDHYLLDYNMRWWATQGTQDDFYHKALGNLNKYNLYPHKVSLLKGSVKQIVPYLPNEYFDLVLLDGSHSYNDTREALIEIWPKVRNYGYIAFHDTLLEEVDAVFKRYCRRDHLIKAPWGTQKLDFYEIYQNVIPTNNKSLTSGLGLVRVKKKYGNQ